MKRLGILLVIVSSLSSCGMRIETPSYVRETGRWHNGGLAVAKMKNDMEKDEYHATQRATDPTSLDKLLAELEGGQNES